VCGVCAGVGVAIILHEATWDGRANSGVSRGNDLSWGTMSVQMAVKEMVVGWSNRCGVGAGAGVFIIIHEATQFCSSRFWCLHGK
jgi:hypothetical protein